MSLIDTSKFTPREYQKHIAEAALKRNTLVVLPTGMGKTFIALMVAAKRLEKYPSSKILMLAPSRPLVHQHMNFFKKYLKLKEDEFLCATGKIHPKRRVGIYDKAKIIFATPQLIKNDIINDRIKLHEFSCLIVDECHHSVKRYPYPFIAKKFKEQSLFPLILGLTASPGGTYEKIDEIKRNLFIESVEIRTERDKDVSPYVHKIFKEWVYVNLPVEFEKIRVLLRESVKDNLEWLKEYNFIRKSKISKKSLLQLNQKLLNRIVEGVKNPVVFSAIRKVTDSIRVAHALELLETQGISPLVEYLEKIWKGKKKSERRLLKDPRIREAFKLAIKLQEKKEEHPKFRKLLLLVKDFLRKEKNAKIIVFANYRDTVKRIKEFLEKNGIKSEILIGQSMRRGKGLTQEKQLEILKKFTSGEFNVLVGTSISEEGLSIPDVNGVIFFDAVPSEIRSIQRRGRTGRTMPGKVIFLLTKGTSDEAFYWAAFHKEKKMKGILYDLMKKKVDKKVKSLKEWLE